MTDAAPPLYSQDAPEMNAEESFANTSASDGILALEGPQILILPTTDAISFQKGFVGAEGERAAIEGELQIKGATSGLFNKIQKIELAASDLILYSAINAAEANSDLPTSLSFAIPLTDDAPQCIHTPLSSLSHTLTACLHHSDPDATPLTKTLIIHTRRYTSHSHTLEIAPETHELDSPTNVEVEVPRSTFKAGEPIPVYVKIPSPPRELVVDQGLRLRNVRAELIRIITVKGTEEETSSLESNGHKNNAVRSDPFVQEGPSSAAVATAVEKIAPAFMDPQSQTLVEGSSYKTIVSRSGASCRFHSSLPVKLRFVLRQPPPSSSPPDRPGSLPDNEYGYLDGDTHCASITQDTLLHSVLFRVNVHVSFVDMSNRTERISTISIPIVMIPPPAPLPEVEEWVDVAYQKKHDKPPSKTVRAEDWEASVPHYQEGEAGPSAVQSGAPPPFEERDAPPPFFTHAAEASTSTHGAPPPFFTHPEASTSNALPTFQESESGFFVPPDAEQSVSTASAQLIFPGEGTFFGFSPAEQFDGHLEEMQRSSTPPPPLEMASQDTNVTRFAELGEPRHTIEAMGISMQQEETESGRESDLPPPPPPAMDDPSDPPPSIDSDFRSPNARIAPSRHTSPSPPHPLYNQAEQEAALPDSSPADPPRQADGHAPPPYLVPGNEEHVMRPPPYMDLIPPSSDRN
ncbi:hypothetical protein HWV62_27947 [Athelia sp. TMB]|nr:hypothetical protein HWV62_27947 [Athelia sp. TMB]